MARIRFSTPLVKTADYDLPINTDRWTDEIFRMIYKKHPYLTEVLGGDIDWSVDPIDESEGNATGAITALVGGYPIQIPIIVRNGKLKDIDIYISPEGEMDYLSEKVLLQGDTFESVELGQKVNPMLTDRGPLNLGGPGLRSGSRILSKVASYGNFAEDVKRMARHSDDSRLNASWDRISNVVPASRPFDALCVQDMGGHFKVAAYRRGYQIDRFDMTRAEAFGSIDSDVANLARRARGAAVVVPGRTLQKEAVAFAGSSSSKECPAPGSGMSVRTASGEAMSGQVFKRGVLEGDPMGQEVIWIGEGGKYCADVRAHHASGGSAPSLDRKGVNDLKVGCQYALVSDTTAHDLLTYRGTALGMDSKPYHVFHSATEGSVRFMDSSVVPAIRKVRVDGRDVYLLPSSHQFIKADSAVVPALEFQGEDKVAASMLETGEGSATIVYDGEGYLCKVASDSRGIDYWIDSASEATAWLMSLGATRESAESCVKLAHSESGSRTRVYGLEPAIDVDRGDEDMTPQGRAKIAGLLDRWALGRFAITKLAAEIGGLSSESLAKLAQNPFAKKDEEEAPEEDAPEETDEDVPAEEAAPEEVLAEEGAPADASVPVDAVSPSPESDDVMSQDMIAETGVDQEGVLQDDLNAVNLLNQYNAQKFSGATSEIEDAKRNVANLLYRVRTGEIEEVDESVIKDGLTALESIIHGLREIEASKV